MRAINNKQKELVYNVMLGNDLIVTCPIHAGCCDSSPYHSELVVAGQEAAAPGMTKVQQHRKILGT